MDFHEKSRISIADILNCKTSEIIFTSGGSESNNLALRGLLNKGDHFITSSYEHPSILSLAKDLEKFEKGINIWKKSRSKNNYRFFTTMTGTNIP